MKEMYFCFKKHPGKETKIRKFEMAAIFEIFFKSGYNVFLRYPGVENFNEIALSPTVKEIEAILCFATFHLVLKWPSLASELKAKAKIVN